ncbi:MAG: phosphate acyltransferase [Gemmatimonadales bacterium]
MSFRADLRRRAGRLGGRVVLAEGWDPRVRKAGEIIERESVASVTVLDRSVVPAPAVDRVADLLHRRQPTKVATVSQARELARDPVNFAAGLVALGEADAAVAGAVYTTAQVIRAALGAIGPAAGIGTVSSSFYMVLPASRLPFPEASELVLTFTDCGVVPEPTAQELAEIALVAARDRRMVVGDDPVVAFLSYSTMGSADGPRVEKVRQAVGRFREIAPDVVADGELQGDAALVPHIAREKAPGSRVAGTANILVFPDLDSGNIAYKLVQHLAGAGAIGPVLQGLQRPMVDLSRGATVDDVVDVSAVALLQAASPTPRPNEEEG